MTDRDLAHASARVGEIIAAAEQAAEDLRLDAERRLRERVAEGDRAAANRVKAAEAEALEILAAAQEQADTVVAEARRQAAELTEDARRQARQVVADAGAASRDVLRDGTELSGHLRELSSSLRSNAELLLRDIRLAHAEMTARLDQGAPADTRSAGSSPGIDDLDVPEFHPGR
jgi:cell division septum initiation protein DivIVA